MPPKFGSGRGQRRGHGRAREKVHGKQIETVNKESLEERSVEPFAGNSDADSEQSGPPSINNSVKYTLHSISFI